MTPQPKPAKGFLAKLLRTVGIEPTEDALFNVRVTIVLLGIVIVGYSFLTYDDAGEKYGNYDEIKHKLPK